MKKILQYLAAFVMLFSLPAAGFMFLLLFSSSIKQENKTAATANQVDGYIIFFQSTPAAVYETMGEVKIKASITGTPGELFKQVMKKIKKEFPKADAIIFEGVEMEKAQAIKFK